MKHSKLNPASTIHPARRGKECGFALILVLLLIVLVSAIGLGIVYMSNTETSINGNYRDSQLAFFAMRSGLEEVRDRLRTNSVNSVAPPTTMPGSANSVLYFINPAGSTDVVDPKTFSNAYFDDEFCHEAFLGLSSSPVTVPCTAGPPSGSVAAYVNSTSPNTNTASALKYKWVRVTLKQNYTFANGVASAYVDSTQSPTTQICYQTLANQEIPLTLVAGGIYASCAAAQQAGKDASPVYVVTSLAVTPKGSRRIGQYEMASLNVSAPPTALGLDGPAAIFSPVPSSSVYFINGTDSGSSGFTSSGGTGTCNPTGATVPAISTGDATGVAGIDIGIVGPPDRSSQYTGTGPTPSVVNAGSGGTGTFAGQWSTPAQLDNLVSSLANVADTTYSCGIGTPCSPSGPVGTNANPQITYVNGDFNFGDGSGAGVLIVTGTLSFTGNATFNGLILVIGQGAISESGGGNGGFNGSVFLAKTHSSTSPYPELNTLASPLFAWNGGGNSDIQYNSCWATIGNGTRYVPIATREEMY